MLDKKVEVTCNYSFRWPINGKVQDMNRGKSYEVTEAEAKALKSLPGRIRNEDEGVVEEVDILLAKAVDKLSDDNDEHWTIDGKPAIAAVETFLGRDTNRKELLTLKGQRVRNNG